MLFVVLLGAFLLSFASFADGYFRRYPALAAPSFFASFGDAVRQASAQTDGPVCVSGNVNMPYIFVLFYERIDPRVFLRTVVYENPGAEFQDVASFGRYTFGAHRCRWEEAGAVLLRDEEEGTVPPGLFVFRRFPPYLVGVRRPGA